MEKLIHYFTEIESKIDKKLQLDLHEILKKMIKKHFKNDIKKTKELLTMISKNIYETDYDGLTYTFSSHHPAEVQRSVPPAASKVCSLVAS